MSKIYIILLTVFFYANVYSQQAYFVDGYHGGIYGHYPVKWKTQFIVDQLYKHPDWRICLEIEPETWDTVQIQTPEAYRQLKNKVVSKTTTKEKNKVKEQIENNEEEFTMIYIRTMNIVPNRLDRAETGKYMVTYMEYVGVKLNLCRRTIRNGCLFVLMMRRCSNWHQECKKSNVLHNASAHCLLLRNIIDKISIREEELL